jgi:hypothetical protein
MSFFLIFEASNVVYQCLTSLLHYPLLPSVLEYSFRSPILIAQCFSRLVERMILAKNCNNHCSGCPGSLLGMKLRDLVRWQRRKAVINPFLHWCVCGVSFAYKHAYIGRWASILADPKTTPPCTLFLWFLFQLELNSMNTSMCSVCCKLMAGLWSAHQRAQFWHPGFVSHMVPRSFIRPTLCPTTTVYAQLLINLSRLPPLLMHVIPLQPGTPVGKHISYLYIFVFYLQFIQFVFY